ncbi:MAG: alpha-mannosidase [bacterium]
MRRRFIFLAFILPFLLGAGVPVFGEEGFVEEWLVLGVFSYQEGKERLAVDFLGREQEVVPYDGAVTAGRRWKRMHVDRKGKLDFVASGDFGNTENTVCYAHTFLKSPIERNALLLVGSDDAVKIYVNGIEVHSREVARGWRPDQDTVLVRMGAGWNRILAKVANGVGDFALSVRLVDEQGGPLPHIQFQAGNPVGEGPFETVRVSPWLRVKEASFSEFTLKEENLRLALDVTVGNLGTLCPKRAILHVQERPDEPRVAPRQLEMRSYPEETLRFNFTATEISQLAQSTSKLEIEIEWDGERNGLAVELVPLDILSLLFAGVDVEGWQYKRGIIGAIERVDLRSSDWAVYTEGAEIDTTHRAVAFGVTIGVPPELSTYPLALELGDLLGTKRTFINGIEEPISEERVSVTSSAQFGETFTVVVEVRDFQAPLCLDPKLVPVSDDFNKLTTNAKWAAVFTRDAIQLGDEAKSELLVTALELDKSEFYRLLEEENRYILSTSPEIKANTLHVVGNAHIDMAWLWPWSETVEVCSTTFARALQHIEEYPDFVYAQSQAQAYVWMEENYPELFEEIRRRVEDGRWLIVGGTWVEPDNNLPSGESQVRQILYGKRYFQEKFGIDVKIAWIPDSFGFAWTLPQIYRKSGFRYFITQKLTWNDTNEFPYKVFYWQSPDGSQLFSYFPYTYVHDLRPERLASHFVDYEERTGLKDQLVLYGEGDHGGGPSEEMIERVAQLWEIDTFPTVIHDTPLNFMKRVEEDGPALPVCNDELYLEYHRGCYTTQARIKKRNRRCEALLETAEKFAFFSQLEYPSQKLEDAWKRALFNQFHDILPGSSISEVYVDANRDYDLIEESVEGVLNRSLREICGRIETEGEGTPVVVFNPLSWLRDDAVEVGLPEELRGHISVFDRNGHRIPSQVYEDTLIFVAEDIPSIGYKTFWLKSEDEPKEKSQLRTGRHFLETQFYRIEINPKTGNWSRLFDKRHIREVLEPGREGNVLQAFEDLPQAWDAWNIGYTGKIWDIEQVESIEIVERGPVRARLRVTRTFGNSRFVQDVLLYDGLPRIEVFNEVEWHEDHILLKVAFPINVKSDVATYEIPYGTIVRRSVPVTPQDSAKFEVSAHKWIDLSDSTYGVSLLNDCKYGHDVKGNLMRITLFRSPKWPDPNADMGHHTFTYSLYPHSGNWRQALTHRRGYELNYPLIAVLESPHRGDLPSKGSFATIRPEGVVLSVVKKAEAREDLVLRFYELFGEKTRAEIDLSMGFRSAFEADLLENVQAKLETRGNTVYLPTNPYEIKTITVEF